ncbi:MAG: helix-hairpin-helix domain-containing protein [Caldilineaceae bacterium]|nr:helix-hairpin-helix domain-containing protein [Caldilineaceae bacterium]
MNPPTNATDAGVIVLDPAPEPKTPPAFHFLSFTIGLLTALILVGGTLLLVRRPEPAPIVLQPPPTPGPTATDPPTATPAPITVFVSGAVVRPGLYEIEAPARVGAALSMAGGLTDEADAPLINQAELLWDGAQIHVPARGEEGSALAHLVPTAPPPGVSGSQEAAPARGGSVDLGAGLIDLNLATAGELETLPGIGPSKAAAIMANRPYATVDDLTRVPGIGEKTVDQLRAYVTVQ